MLNVAVLENDKHAYELLYNITLLGFVILNADELVLKSISGAEFE